MERAASVNNAPRLWLEPASVPSNRSDAWLPENALPSTAAASPVRSRKISRSWFRMTSLVMSEETTTTPTRTRNVTAETARSGRPALGPAACLPAVDPGMAPPRSHYDVYLNEYLMLYPGVSNGNAGRSSGIWLWLWHRSGIPLCPG